MNRKLLLKIELSLPCLDRPRVMAELMARRGPCLLTAIKRSFDRIGWARICFRRNLCSFDVDAREDNLSRLRHQNMPSEASVGELSQIDWIADKTALAENINPGRLGPN